MIELPAHAFGKALYHSKEVRRKWRRRRRKRRGRERRKGGKGGEGREGEASGGFLRGKVKIGKNRGKWNGDF